MFKVFISSWALLLGMGLLMVGNGMQGTLLGIRGSTGTTTVDVISDLVNLLAVLVYDGGVTGGTGISSEDDPILEKNRTKKIELTGWAGSWGLSEAPCRHIRQWLYRFYGSQAS